MAGESLAGWKSNLARSRKVGLTTRDQSQTTERLGGAGLVIQRPVQRQSLLLKMGGRLSAFPESIGDTYAYELGSPRLEDRFAFYFALRACTLDSAGHCALQLTMNNNRQQPEAGSCSFSIRAEAAAINRLGRLLKTFGELQHTALHWSDTAGEHTKHHTKCTVTVAVTDTRRTDLPP